MHNPVNTAISFALLIVIVGFSFFYVGSLGPVEAPKEPYLGVTIRQITPAIAQAIELEPPEGLLVVSVVPEGPADKAGMKSGDKPTIIEGEEIPLGGDVIVGIDGNDVRTVNDLRLFLNGKQVGDTVKFVVIRDDGPHEISVTLEERPG